MLKIFVFTPYSFSTLGNLSKSIFTQSGAYPDNPFFQLPNHNKTNLILYSLASEIIRFISVKSNLFSFFSIKFQYTGTKRVLQFNSFIFSQAIFIYSAEEAAELCNSAANIINGLSSINNIYFLLNFLICGKLFIQFSLLYLMRFFL